MTETQRECPMVEEVNGRYVLQEHLAPSTLFSVAAFSQVHWRAGCFPQEQVASLAQTHPAASERPQQVAGTAEDIMWRVKGYGYVKEGVWLEWSRVE